MSFLSDLIGPFAKEAEESALLAEIAGWKKIFNNSFGSSEPGNFVRGDEAFYRLLTLNQHATIVERMIEAPERFCRAKILSALFLGESTEKVDGKKEERHYPKVTGATATTAVEAVSPILAKHLQEIVKRHPGGVGPKFWITNPNHSEYDASQSGGEDAQDASGLMHCLLNAMDSIDDKNARREAHDNLEKWFVKAFGNLPIRVDVRLGRVVQLVKTNSRPVRRQGQNGHRKTEGSVQVPRSTPQDHEKLVAYRVASGPPPENNALADAGLAAIAGK